MHLNPESRNCVTYARNYYSKFGSNDNQMDCYPTLFTVQPLRIWLYATSTRNSGSLRIWQPVACRLQLHEALPTQMASRVEFFPTDKQRIVVQFPGEAKDSDIFQDPVSARSTVTGVTFPEGKAAIARSDHLPLPDAEYQNKCSCNSTPPPSMCLGGVSRNTFTFLLSYWRPCSPDQQHLDNSVSPTWKPITETTHQKKKNPFHVTDFRDRYLLTAFIQREFDPHRTLQFYIYISAQQKPNMTEILPLR